MIKRWLLLALCLLSACIVPVHTTHGRPFANTEAVVELLRYKVEPVDLFDFIIHVVLVFNIPISFAMDILLIPGLAIYRCLH